MNGRHFGQGALGNKLNLVSETIAKTEVGVVEGKSMPGSI
jgi:hypothetical protein